MFISISYLQIKVPEAGLKLHLRFFKLKFVSDNPANFTGSQVPITGFNCSQCGKGFAYEYDDLIDAIQTNGLETNSTDWKQVYYSWKMVGRGNMIVFILSIFVIVFSFFTCIFLLTQLKSGFIVGPDTILFLVTAVFSVAMLLDYVIKVVRILEQDKTWATNTEKPTCTYTGYVLEIC